MLIASAAIEAVGKVYDTLNTKLFLQFGVTNENELVTLTTSSRQQHESFFLQNFTARFQSPY